MKFTVNFTQMDKGIAERLRKVTGPGLETLGIYIAGKMKQDSEASWGMTADPSTGVRWEPWKESTAKAFARERANMRTKKARTVKARRLLWDTGAMHGTVATEVVVGGGVAAIGIGVSEARGAHKYAPAHQFGTQHMVARPAFGLTPASIKEIQGFIAQAVGGNP